jgi:hypothetical protein
MKKGKRKNDRRKRLAIQVEIDWLCGKQVGIRNEAQVAVGK